MSGVAHYSCDFCNPTGRIDVDYGHDAVTLSSGMVSVGIPEDWWEIPGYGRSKDGNPGHACPRCIRERPEVRHMMARARAEMMEEVVALHPPPDDEHPGQLPTAEDLERAAKEVFGETPVEE